MTKTYPFRIALLLILPFLLFSCDELGLNNDDPDDPGDITEKIAEEKSTEYTGVDTELEFTNGAVFKINPADNPGAEQTKVTIAQLDDESYFNGDNHLIFDFNKIAGQYKFDFSVSLPAGLVAEDIVAILYKPVEESEVLDAFEVKFNYDKGTGKLQAGFTAPANNPDGGKFPSFLAGKKYSRLHLSWSDREKLSESPKEVTIPMPFYEQPEGSCWATCATMFARAYTATSDRNREIRVIDFAKYMEHPTLSEGIGLYSFKKWLPSSIKIKSGAECEVSTYVSKSNLLEKIIEKINEKKPLIINMDYPGVGGHAVLVTGYRIDLISASRISVELQLHNPQNVGSESMYTWKDFDWLMKEKSFTEAFQVLYAKSAVPDSRALQTMGMPLNNNLGKFNFRVKSPETGKSYSILMKYDSGADRAYSWYFPNSEICEELPDSTEALVLDVPVYNAAASSKNLQVNVRLYDNEEGDLLIEEVFDHTAGPGESSFMKELPVNVIAAGKKLNCRMEFEIRDAGTFLDGYNIHFTLLPSLTKQIVMFLEADAEFRTTHNGNASYSEDPITMGVGKMTLNGDGKTFEGELSEEMNLAGQKIKLARKLKVVFDKDVNPTKIETLDFEYLTETTYEGVKVHDGRTFAVIKNIELRASEKSGKGWRIERFGTEVCDIVHSTGHKVTPAGPDGATVEMTKFKCESNSQFYITID